LVTTVIEEAAIASSAITGFKNPATARGIATML